MRMSALDEARQRINEIDREMARLYEMRMHAVMDVAKYKLEQNMPILDRAREADVIERGARLICDETLRPYYIEFIRGTMKTSREYQKAFLLRSPLCQKKIEIQTALFSYPVHFVRGGLSSLDEFFSLERKVLILTDSGVPSAYADAIHSCAREGYVYVVEEGEGSKNLEVFTKIQHFLLANDFTRHDCIVAVGGGVVCDIAGFVASAYMRGIDFYTVPTTLLCAVDASVGGKTAVNFEGVKNILGAFYPPRGVLIDADTFVTLPDRQMASGLCEVIKIAAISDADFFETLENATLTPSVIDEIVYRSVALKALVVECDERESGQRKLLNFGHTFGHAIEAGSSLTHGESVALGMLAFSSEKVRERLCALYQKFKLPLSLPVAPEDIVHFIDHDKKSEGDTVDVIFVDEIGKGKITKMKREELKAKLIEKYKEEVR